MDSVVLPPLSSAASSAQAKRKKSSGKKKPSKIKYGHNVIKDLFNKLKDDTPKDTVLRGGPDNLPLLFKRESKWVLHFDSKTADGGVLYYPWPQVPPSADIIEATLEKKLFDIRTDPPLAALNHVRFSKTRRILNVERGKKWVPNDIMPMETGENKGKALIFGQWRVPGTSIGGHADDYPEWILDEYEAKFPKTEYPKTKRSKPTEPIVITHLHLNPMTFPSSTSAPTTAPVVDNTLQLPPPPVIDNTLPLPPVPVVDNTLQMPPAPASPERPSTAAPGDMPSPAISLTPSMASIFGSGSDLWDDRNEVDLDIDITIFNMDMTAKRKASIRRSISCMTKKQITGVLNRRFKLKWDDSTKISAVTMKESFANVLFSPATVYDYILPKHLLLAKEGELMYKVPMDEIKTEINKLLRKAGEETI